MLSFQYTLEARCIERRVCSLIIAGVGGVDAFDLEVLDMTFSATELEEVTELGNVVGSVFVHHDFLDGRELVQDLVDGAALPPQGGHEPFQVVVAIKVQPIGLQDQLTDVPLVLAHPIMTPGHEDAQDLRVLMEFSDLCRHLLVE